MPETTASPGRHVAFLVFPFTSHATLLFGLLRRLAAASPNTTFSFHSTAKSNRSIFTTSVPANVKPFDIPDGLPEGFMFSAEKPEEGVNFFMGAAEEGFRASMAAAVAEMDRPIGCVVTDAFLWFSAGLAEEAGATWIPLYTAGACSLFTLINTDLIREIVGTDVSGRENEIVKFIPGFSELRLGDLPSEILFGNLQSPFSIMLHQMSRVLHKATAVLVNSFEGLEPEHHKALVQKLRKVLPIGPFSLTSPPQLMDDPYGCILWLDRHRPASVAYIGFGNVATLPPHELVALAEALEASGTPFLWSMGDKSRENLPEGFMTRTREIGKIVSWAPQVKVLEHQSIGVFINHCGWGSVLESIVAGVPIIGMPVWGDNQMNAWMVENVLKIGVRVEGGNFTKHGTISALEAVLKTEKGKKLKDQIENYKELALKAVGPQGSSTKNFNTLVGVLTGN